MNFCKCKYLQILSSLYILIILSKKKFSTELYFNDFCVNLLPLYIAITSSLTISSYRLDSIQSRGQKRNIQRKGFEKKSFVNSQILSITTETDLGVLDPPLNLILRHIQYVRYQKRFLQLYNKISYIQCYSIMDCIK